MSEGAEGLRGMREPSRLRGPRGLRATGRRRSYSGVGLRWGADLLGAEGFEAAEAADRPFQLQRAEILSLQLTMDVIA